MSGKSEAKGWHIVRLTLEAVSPLSCGAGEGLESDNAIARDANGLPMIPGATLQGLLRRECDPELRDALFGKETANGTQAGRLFFSSGAVHDSQNRAVQADPPADDALLARLQAPVPLERDHVRLDHRHGAADEGKFDRTAVPRGTRFSFEIALFGASGEAEKLKVVLAPLAAPWFRIGSSRARGYGKVKLVGEPQTGFFPLERASDLRTLRQRPLNDSTGLERLALSAPAACLTITLSLTPINPWRTGQTGVRVTTQERRTASGDDQTKDVDLAPIREPFVDWSSGTGLWSDPPEDQWSHYVLPGSSLRGPLAHRALYHWNRANGRMIDADDADAETQIEAYRKRGEDLAALFGEAREGVKDDQGSASPLIVDDAELTVGKVIAVNHVKIDRFSGGAWPRALFNEELIDRQRINCTLHLRTSVSDSARAALIEALVDLCEGRLALGAKSMAFCTGEAPTFHGDGAADWQACWNTRTQAAIAEAGATEEAGATA